MEIAWTTTQMLRRLLHQLRLRTGPLSRLRRSYQEPIRRDTYQHSADLDCAMTQGRVAYALIDTFIFTNVGGHAHRGHDPAPRTNRHAPRSAHTTDRPRA